MKIYPNDLCPCGSGKKYKKCCMTKTLKKTDTIGSLPVYKPDQNADFYINPRGAVVFKDESKQPILDIPEGSVTKTVLSVGISETRKPMVTVHENEGSVCYFLPNWYLDWCQTCVGIATEGNDLFPSDVVFGLNNGKYSADIL